MASWRKFAAICSGSLVIGHLSLVICPWSFVLGHLSLVDRHQDGEDGEDGEDGGDGEDGEEGDIVEAVSSRLQIRVDFLGGRIKVE